MKRVSYLRAHTSMHRHTNTHYHTQISTHTHKQNTLCCRTLVTFVLFCETRHKNVFRSPFLHLSPSPALILLLNHACSSFCRLIGTRLAATPAAPLCACTHTHTDSEKHTHAYKHANINTKRHARTHTPCYPPPQVCFVRFPSMC